MQSSTLVHPCSLATFCEVFDRVLDEWDIWDEFAADGRYNPLHLKEIALELLDYHGHAEIKPATGDVTFDNRVAGCHAVQFRQKRLWHIWWLSRERSRQGRPCLARHSFLLQCLVLCLPQHLPWRRTCPPLRQDAGASYRRAKLRHLQLTSGGIQTSI